MKNFIVILVLFLAALPAVACPVCERQQPKFLQGISHGAGPQSNWDYLIIAVTAVIVLFTLFFSIKWLLFPGERSGNHIKHLILNQE